MGLRALVRNRAAAAPLEGHGVQLVAGDLDDPRSLPASFEGATELWLLVANGPRAAEHSSNAVWAARQAGIERVVRLSAIGAGHDAPTRSGRLHALSDHELQESGLRWTILRPHWFMQNLLDEAGAIAARGSFSLNMGDGRLGMIDVRDVARLAAHVLADDSARHDGRIYRASGPESISFTDVAERLTRLLGRPVAYRPASDETQRETLLAYGVPAWVADMVVEYGQAYSAGWGEATSRDFLDVVGHPPRHVDTFLRDHMAAFAHGG
jgi:uncharacterized protein YbjT (DUF2867 family)